MLHDSASITVPLRSNGAVPRNHFNHNKGRSLITPPSRSSRRSNHQFLSATCLNLIFSRSGPAAAGVASSQPADRARDTVRVLRHADTARRPHQTRDGLPSRPGAFQPAEGRTIALARLFRGDRCAVVARGRAAVRVLLGHDTGVAAAQTSSDLSVIYFVWWCSFFTTI